MSVVPHVRGSRADTAHTDTPSSPRGRRLYPPGLSVLLRASRFELACAGPASRIGRSTSGRTQTRPRSSDRSPPAMKQCPVWSSATCTWSTRAHDMYARSQPRQAVRSLRSVDPGSADPLGLGRRRDPPCRRTVPRRRTGRPSRSSVAHRRDARQTTRADPPPTPSLTALPEHVSAGRDHLDHLDQFGDAGIAVVTFATPERLAAYREHLRLPLDVVADTDRTLYRLLGAERGSNRQVWSAGTLRMYARLLRAGRRLHRPTEDIRTRLTSHHLLTPDEPLPKLSTS